jgi:kumamolisin
MALPISPKVAAHPQHAVTELAVIYDFPEAEQKGSGQTIAILALGGRLDRDEFDQYCTSIGIEMPEVVEVSVDRGLPQLGDVPDEDAEVALDVYIIAALVPSARIAIYYAENTSQGFLNGLARAIYNDKLPASILCITWGMHEESWTLQAMWAIDELLADAKDLGVTVCCASGDMGFSDGAGDDLPHVDFPASSPNVLSCGGTTLTPNPKNPRGLDESVWNAGNEAGTLYASGGGESKVFAKPYWQLQSGDPELEKRERRGVPDVAGFADPRNGLTITISGKTVLVGGTSAVAPVWAGLIARINENLGKPVGYLNRLLYLYVSRGAFFDIEEGDNGKWSAAGGWDASTGLGSPRGETLLQELKRLLP